MKPLKIDEIAGLSGYANKFTLYPEQNVAGKFTGISVNVVEYGSERDLTKENLIQVLECSIANRVSHLGFWLQNVNAMFAEKARVRGYTESLAEIHEYHKPVVRASELIDTARQYLRLLKEGIEPTFTRPFGDMAYELDMIG